MKKCVKDIVLDLGLESFYYKLYCLKNIKKLKELCNGSIKSNVRYENMYKGERCFILGSGPSLKKVDLNLLSDEFVISFNNIYKIKDYDKLNVNAYICTDDVYFERSNDKKMEREDIIKGFECVSKSKPICFFPSYAYEFLSSINASEMLDIHYFHEYDSVNEKSIIHYDYSKGVSSYRTVLQYGISLAIYMGFSEIYLLGCDGTIFLGLINERLDKNSMDMHAFDDKVNSLLKSTMDNWSMLDVMKYELQQCIAFRKLYLLCQEKNITIKNLSETTLIDEIPRDNICNIIKAN